jgi:3-hydroxyisobutyrate dehydrogenase-like beta-hydroxyacid dehydrogenase
MAASLPALAAPGKTRIGFVGTGIMGSSMCGHLLAAGYETAVFTRTRAKADALVAKGATFEADARAVAARSDVLFLIVGFPEDVRAVLLGSEGALSALAPRSIVVDCTTSSPALAREIAAAASARGCHALDSPVSGGDAGARNATLSLMVGGERAAFDAVEPLLRTLGTPHYLGPAGAGQHCKAGNQIVIASTMVGLCEGLVYAHAAGLDLDAYLTAIRGGAAGSRSLELYAPRLRKGDMQPGFLVKHFLKDLRIALDECNRMRLALPGLALAQQLYAALAAHGDEELGTQALVLTLERMNNIKLPTTSE